jgi:hypothetical protein
MLERLEMRDVGPAPSMRLDLAPRLNVLAGDNGVGKTFVLDVAWWVLTSTWVDHEAAPHRGEAAHPTIRWADRRNGETYEVETTFRFAEQDWYTLHVSKAAAMRPTPVLYARVDGGFSIWDPLRFSGHGRFPLGGRTSGLMSAFHFAPLQVWDGLTAVDGTTLCNGLIRDWATWQLQRGHAFETLTRVLEGLSPHPGETIRPGATTTRVSIHDVRDIPTLDMPYGNIPVVHASAGMKRVLALAYMLVWMWREHVAAAKLKNTPASRGFVVLFDEAEAHLHPQWQRVLLPALLRVVHELELTPAQETAWRLGGLSALRSYQEVEPSSAEVQILATTHAPLVLASLEPHFDEARDALFHFELKERQVQVSKVPWRARGDASAWLTSDVFDLGEARSVEAEQAIVAAKEAMRRPDLPIEEARRIHHELHAVLKDTDPFWPRWLVRAKQAGVAP